MFFVSVRLSLPPLEFLCPRTYPLVLHTQHIPFHRPLWRARINSFLLSAKLQFSTAALWRMARAGGARSLFPDRDFSPRLNHSVYEGCELQYAPTGVRRE